MERGGLGVEEMEVGVDATAAAVRAVVTFLTFPCASFSANSFFAFANSTFMSATCLEYSVHLAAILLSCCAYFFTFLHDVNTGVSSFTSILLSRSHIAFSMLTNESASVRSVSDSCTLRSFDAV